MNSAAKTVQKIEWTVHPMREKPLKGLLFWALLLFILWAVYWNIITVFTPSQSLFFTFIAFLVLLSSLTSFYLPTRFVLNSEGAELNRWFFHKKMSWDRIMSLADEKTGLFLSPFPVRTRLENYRGIYLYYRGNRNEILDFIDLYKPELNGVKLESSARREDPAINGNENNPKTG